MAGPRNRHGVNDASDCFRTIKGERYDAWTSAPSDEQIKAYRDKGVRCRRFGEELFVHVADSNTAAEVDAAKVRTWLRTRLGDKTVADLGHDRAKAIYEAMIRLFPLPGMTIDRNVTEARVDELLVANNALLQRARDAEEGLFLMREFAVRNATVWEAGSNHHHPIWTHVAELLHENYGHVQINAAKRYAFIHPENKRTLESLRDDDSEWICPICDGGPGNQNSCSCPDEVKW